MRIIRFIGNNFPGIVAFLLSALNIFADNDVFAIGFSLMALLFFVIKDNTNIQADQITIQMQLHRIETLLIEIRDR